MIAVVIFTESLITEAYCLVSKFIPTWHNIKNHKCFTITFGTVFILFQPVYSKTNRNISSSNVSSASLTGDSDKSTLFQGYMLLQ